MREIISREWPELLEWPFNTPVGMTKVVLDAKSLRAKIRKKISKYIA
jgi:hypothetical protein